MVSFEDDDDNGADSSSENDADEAMEDVDEADADADGDPDADADADADGDAEADADGDVDAEGENDEDEGDNEEDEEQEQEDIDSPSQSQLPSRTVTSAQTPLPNGASSGTRTAADGASASTHTVRFAASPATRPPSFSIKPLPFRPNVRPEALAAPVYDIVPTIAAPHSTSINVVTATPDMRWVFTGGTDGYIRKFNWVDSANAKLMLTVAQRHPFVDSVTKAGVLTSYWENEESSVRTPPQSDETSSLSPVYSLAVHHQALWLLSGLDSGGINMYSVRHSEGHRITCLKQHTSAVSVLSLAPDERSALSGSWDKTILDWDLDTGQARRAYTGSGGQISAIERRPQSSLPVPEQSASSLPLTNGTITSNNTSKPRPLANGVSSNDAFPNGVNTPEIPNSTGGENGAEDAPGSPESHNSLFGDNESLFGDNNEGAVGNTTIPGMDDDDDEFSKAIANGIQQIEEDGGGGDVEMADAGVIVEPPDVIVEAAASMQQDPGPLTNGVADSQLTMAVNGLSHSDEPPIATGTNRDTTEANATSVSDTTFLDASFDGTLRIWDRRQPNPIARITPPRGIPPWCMGACWSPDGNSIYAGRRNGTVDEYSLYKGLHEPRRTFKFPAGSGPVSAVRAMPNGRHLVCASYDILRLYDLDERETSARRAAVPFLIVPGHRTGVISQLYIDPTCTFMISTAGNRGWEGSSTEVMLGYEIGFGK